ncbi:MAG: transposase [Deltaproteobacteria bacterium]|nr:transposase [Deltaproteobacteria bacterium]
MGEALERGVKNYLSNAEIVFDRFYLLKLMLQKLEELRRKVFASAVRNAKKALKAFLRA